MKRINVVQCQMVKERNLMYDFKTIRTPEDAACIIKDFIGASDRECFVLLCLDTKNNVNAIHTVSIGSLNTSIVHPREVFKIAILANAAGIIVGHNHPSGNTTPSSEDTEVTKGLVKAGTILNIPLLDHVIVNSDNRSYVSYKERGII